MNYADYKDELPYLEWLVKGRVHTRTLLTCLVGTMIGMMSVIPMLLLFLRGQ